MEIIKCIICQSKEYQPLYNLNDYLLENMHTQTSLVKCLNCGLIYQNPRPTLEEMGDYYPPEYESYDTGPEPGKNPWLLNKAIQYGIDKRCRLINNQKKGGEILDIGCASGVFLSGMARYLQWHLSGVEINHHAAQTAKEKYKLNVFEGTLEEAAYPENMFDAITLWDVLEHLHDPVSSLKEIRRILKPDGILVIRVPNQDSWEAKLFGPCWAGLDPPRHLFVFDKNTLNLTLQLSGFKIKSVHTSMGIYLTFTLSFRFWLLTKKIGKKFRDNVNKFLNHPIARLFSSPFFFALGIFQRSPLLTVAAVKVEL